MRRRIVVLIIALELSSLFTVIAIGVMLHAETIWGTGVGLLLFDALLIPVFLLRAKLVGRADTGEPIVAFTYSYREADGLAVTIPRLSAKKRRGAAIIICACLAFIGLVMTVVVHEGNPELPLWQLLFLLAPTLLPWLALSMYGAYEKSLILRDPCRTLVGRHFLLLANTRPIVNERADLTAAGAEIIGADGEKHLRVTYKSTAKMKYGGSVKFSDPFDILIPQGQEDAARAAAAQINAQK